MGPAGRVDLGTVELCLLSRRERELERPTLFRSIGCAAIPKCVPPPKQGRETVSQYVAVNFTCERSRTDVPGTSGILIISGASNFRSRSTASVASGIRFRYPLSRRPRTASREHLEASWDFFGGSLVSGGRCIAGAWYASGRTIARPQGCVRPHQLEPAAWWQRLYALPLYHLLVDPDGRPGEPGLRAR